MLPAIPPADLPEASPLRNMSGQGIRAPRSVLSLTRPSKEFFSRQRALLRRATPPGFPSSSDDHVEWRSADTHHIRHRKSTFFMRVAGDSMRGRGIFDGDLLVVDRALPVTHGCVVIAVLRGEFMVKQILYSPDGQILRAAHPAYPDLHIKAERDISIWGVVSWNVHKLKHMEIPSVAESR